MFGLVKKRKLYLIENYKTLSLYQLFGVFFIGCFLGVLVELLYCFALTGWTQSRQGLIIGPFNLVYGFGALVMTVALFWMRNRHDFIIFITSMFVGSFVEYSCSFFQESLLGSTSWDYSHMPFNLHGRICLLYAFYWGILGVVWLRIILPVFLHWLSYVPKKWKNKLTLILLLFMLFNTLLSVGAVRRWNQREKENEPNSLLDSCFDSYFNDSTMKKIYPNMDFK